MAPDATELSSPPTRGQSRWAGGTHASASDPAAVLEPSERAQELVGPDDVGARLGGAPSGAGPVPRQLLGSS